MFTKRILLVISLFFALLAFLFVSYNNCDYKELENGYECSGMNFFAVPINNAICELSGGVFRTYTNPVWTDYSSMTFVCYLPLNDANESCMNSNQCEGICTVEHNIVDSSCSKLSDYTYQCNDTSGTCSKYDLSECERYYEINDGLVEENLQFCD